MSTELSTKQSSSPIMKNKYTEYDLQNTIAKSFCPIANLHGFKSKIRIIEPQGDMATKKDGVYIILSKNDKYINGADSLTDKDLYQEHILQNKKSVFYPNIMIYKIDHENRLYQLSNITEKIQINEFIINRFREWKFPQLEEFLEKTKEKILDKRRASADDIAKILEHEAKKCGFTENPNKINNIARKIFDILCQNTVNKGEAIIEILNNDLYPTIEIPKKVSANNYRVMLYDYKQINLPNISNEQRDKYKRFYDYHMTIIESGLKEVDYLDLNKNNKNFEFKDMLEYYDIIKGDMAPKYYSKSPKNIPVEELVDKCMETKSVFVCAEALPKLEELLQKVPDLYYNIDKDSIVTPDFIDYSSGVIEQSSKRHLYNRIIFDADMEQIITSNMYIAEHPQLQSKVQYWTKSDIENIDHKRYGIALPCDEIEMFTKYADIRNIEFFIDMNGTYVDSTINTIGIVTENQIEQEKVNNCIKQIYNAKSQYKIAQDVEQFKKQQKAKSNER